MGISFSGVLDEKKRQGNVNVIHDLYSLERKVCHKLDEQASKLYIKALHDECLPIVCAVDKKQKILLNVDSVSSDETRTKINEILRGDYLDELIKLLAEKLNSTVGTTTAGEEDSLYTHVVFANKSVLRIDLFVYHRRFRPTETLSEYNNILAYFVQVGLVEIVKARPQVLIYELTKATNHAKLIDACEKLEELAKCTERLNYTVQPKTKVPHVPSLPTGNSCRIKAEAASEKRYTSFLENLTWGSFGKLMALTIAFAIFSTLTAHMCNTKCRWMSSTNLFFSIRELSRRQMPGLYLLYFFRR